MAPATAPLSIRARRIDASVEVEVRAGGELVLRRNLICEEPGMALTAVLEELADYFGDQFDFTFTSDDGRPGVRDDGDDDAWVRRPRRALSAA